MAQSAATEDWKTEADSVWQFGLLAAPNLGEYGGGDGLKLSCPLIVMKLPSSRIPIYILNKLPSQINECITMNNNIPKEKRVARLPEEHINYNDFITKWSKTCHFELQSHVPLATNNRYNIMYQGWLFKDIPNDPQRLGCSLFPLIGIYDSFGCLQFNEQLKININDDKLHYAGYNNLNWSDQHCHLDFGAWHFGSDMSKIIVDLTANFIKFWSVCIDCNNKKIDISLIYIIGHLNVSNVEGMIRNCNPQQSLRKCQQFYQLFTAVFDKDFEKIKGEKSILSKLLFGYDLNENENINQQKDNNNNNKEQKEMVTMDTKMDKSEINTITTLKNQLIAAHLKQKETDKKVKDLEKTVEELQEKLRIEQQKNNNNNNNNIQQQNDKDMDIDIDEEQDAMKETLNDMITKDKQTKIAQFVENEDVIRDPKDC